MNPPNPTVRVTSPVQGVSGTTLYEAVSASGAPIPGPRIAVIARMHGNEPVGDPVLLRLAAEIGSHLVCGAVLTVRANEAGAALDARHTVGGTDMNRLWDTATLRRLASASQSSTASLCYEEARALELSPLVLGCDAVLDLHSTSRPAAPFLVMRDDQAHATLALKLGVQRLITGLHENAILSGGVAANVGLYPAERGGRLGFTFEAGQHTDPETAARAWDVTVRTLAGLGAWSPAPPPPDVRAEVYEITERVIQASADVEPFRFVGYDGGEAGGGRRGLPARRLHSFDEIQADEVVLRRGRTEVVRAHTAFTMLMPAPATPPGTDLYYVAQPRQGGLSNGVPRTDAEARREALAIERMLDLLGDDEFERGTTWVGFDNRRLFDQCASIIGRAIRLDEGHPHRRIVIVGRGDTNGDEPERRAGHRYREAMRTAVSDGLPIERIQLLRGASLGWIDALTGHGMLELIDRRSARSGADSVRMRLSFRQPHTASLLIGGDLGLALSTGDLRHVRVAMLIEAATVEPDGPTARVRVVRSGLVSTRPEVIAAAGSLLATLRDEHRSLVRQGALADVGPVRDLLLPDDAIEAVPDAERMEALRQTLYRSQLRLWCDQLRLELTRPVPLATDGDVGAWLARTMAATGILDPDALRGIAIRRVGGGYIADPDAIEALYEQVHRPGPTDDLPLAPFGTAPPPSPPQPLFASDVTADDLERWVSWTRFVRGFQVVPETRGKDLDLAFDGGDIRDRLTRWFDGARALAAGRPEDVLVVVAGDGLNPTRDRMSDAFPLYRSQRALVLDPNVRYLRIQHAQGTHLAWMKDFLHTLSQRPASDRSVAVQFEIEHGATVNVILVLERDRTIPEGIRPWSLDGWDIVSCGVVLSDLESLGTENYKVGMFTERLPGKPQSLNLELLHFGRAHCEGLLVQAGARVEGQIGPEAVTGIEDTLVRQIARWIERVRVWKTSSHSTPADPDVRATWVARRLGLADLRLAHAIGQQMDRTDPALGAARALWDAVPAWPGPPWTARADGATETPDAV
ncbi:MAG: succinylglutamate desuccinylase/aspartoacylase family protein [Myxococcota bacterium]